MVTWSAIRGAAQSACIIQGDVLAMVEAVVITMTRVMWVWAVTGVVVSVSGARLKLFSILIFLCAITDRVTCPAVLVTFLLLLITILT